MKTLFSHKLAKYIIKTFSSSSITTQNIKLSTDFKANTSQNLTKSKEKTISELPVNIDSTGKIKIDTADAKIRNPNDPFRLSKVENTQQLFKIYKMSKNGYSLNEKLHFFDRLLELNQTTFKNLQKEKDFIELLSSLKSDLRFTSKNLIPYSQNNFNENTLTAQELEDWSNSEQNRINLKRNIPKIGKLSLLMNNLDVNDAEIWELMENHIVNDQYLDSFEEIVNAMEGFITYKGRLETSYNLLEDNTKKYISKKNFDNPVFILPFEKQSEAKMNFFENKREDTFLLTEIGKQENQKSELIYNRLRKIFKTLERGMIVSIFETNVRHIRRISDFLTLTESPNEYTFQVLEHYAKIAVTLAVPCKLDDIFQLYINFSKSEKGSIELCEYLEHMLIGDRIYGFVQKRLMNYFDTSEKISVFLQCQREIQTRHPDYKMFPELQIKIKDGISNKYLDWSIQHVLLCLENIELIGLQKSEVDELEAIIVQNLLKKCKSQSELNETIALLNLENKMLQKSDFLKQQFENIRQLYEKSERK